MKSASRRRLRHKVSHKRVSSVPIQIIPALAKGERVGLAGAGAGDVEGEWLIFDGGVLDGAAGGGGGGAEMIRESPSVNRRIRTRGRLWPVT